MSSTHSYPWCLLSMDLFLFRTYALNSPLFLTAFPSLQFLPSFVFIKCSLLLFFKKYVLFVWICSFTCLLVVNIRFLIALLISNLHTLNCIHLMCTIQWFLLYFKVMQPSPDNLIVEYFYYHRKKPCSQEQSFSPLS